MKYKIREMLLGIDKIQETSMEQVRTVFVNIVLLLATLVLLFDLYNSIANGFWMMAYAETIVIAVFILVYLLFRNGWPLYYTSVIAVGGITFLSLFSLNIEGYGKESALFWVASLPLYIFLLFGTREGIRWSIAITLGIALSAANAHYKWIPPIFSFDLLIQLVVGFLAISVTVYYFEKVRSSYEMKLDYLVKEREVLLKELHHRVKNNMQVMMSMLWLQVDKIEDPKYAQMFLENIDRLSAMAQVHENLYKADSLEMIEIKKYVKDLLEGLKKVSPYTMEYDLDSVSLDMKSAVNIGLIVNEAVTNAMQHANMTGDGVISVELKKQENDWLQIIIADRGVNAQAIEEVEGSMGLALIKDMVRNLNGGRMRIESKDGFRLIVDFRQEVR